MTDKDTRPPPQARGHGHRPAAEPVTATASHGPGPEVFTGAAVWFQLVNSAWRLHLAWLVAGGEHDVNTLARRVGAPLSTVSHHLVRMKDAGLVHSRPCGRRQLYRACDPDFVEVVGRIATPVFRQPPSARSGGS
ncbi:ArsR/SmtB family transcription factor [Streptomyces cyslabdanicus]|uniref:ArsR/SmtB family transcription factor n=1 Tax=Streptomyces cyslabdanicus TaxID=1470456 RepID=UPI0040444E89